MAVQGAGAQPAPGGSGEPPQRGLSRVWGNRWRRAWPLPFSRVHRVPKDLTFQKHRDTHIAQFFASNKAQIPEFYSLFKDCALVTASSAGAERVFSLFSNTFGDQQTRSLEDYIETTLMLQYRVRELTWGRA